MADYAFYVNDYLGSAIPENAFPGMATQARHYLNKWKRRYQVTVSGPESEGMAICAMADALAFFVAAQNGSGAVTSASIGSVSVSYGGAGAVDLSPRGQARELYRCASQYLDIYRGVG
jgi:hypothetical protein